MNSKTPTILIIEDDASLQRLYQEALSEAGYNIIISQTVADGLHQAKTRRPDLILLDIMLPGGQNGFDFLESLNRDPDLAPIPVIVLTNLDNQREVALSIGAADCLVKANIPLDQVVATAKKYLPQAA